MQKYVNGVLVDVDAEEAAAIQAAQATAQTVVPPTVSAFQAKAALTNAGLYTEADTAITSSGDQILQLAWKTATEFQRESPSIAKIAVALNLPSAQVDALFIAAGQIIA